MDGIKDKGILIVDDNGGIRTSLETALKDDGHEKVYTAHDGYECLRILEERGDEIYVVILDMRLPSSHNTNMNGDAILCNLINSYKGIVGIIPLSAHFDEFPKDYIKSLSNDTICINDCIEKPYDIYHMCSEVRSTIKLIEDKRFKNSIDSSKKSHDVLVAILDSLKYEMEILKNEVDCSRRQIQCVSENLIAHAKDITAFGKDLEYAKNLMQTITSRQDKLEDKFDILIDNVNSLSQKHIGPLAQLGLSVWNTLLVALVAVALLWGLDKFVLRFIEFVMDF